jgi:hypothetical protein
LNSKKIFFVNPHPVIRRGIIDKLIDRDYEIYIIEDYKDITHICRSYANPYIFLNIDEGLNEQGWLTLTQEVLSQKELSHAKLGILTHNDNRVLAKQYLMELMVPCGFIVLSQDTSKGQEQILTVFDANEINVDRRNVRAQCHSEHISFNLFFKGKFRYGQIREISSTGMTIRFDRDRYLLQGTLFDKVQIKLKGILTMVSAVVVGHCEDEEGHRLYLFLFKELSVESRLRIRQFVHWKIQSELQKQLTKVRHTIKRHPDSRSVSSIHNYFRNISPHYSIGA